MPGDAPDEIQPEAVEEVLAALRGERLSPTPQRPAVALYVGGDTAAQLRELRVGDVTFRPTEEGLEVRAAGEVTSKTFVGLAAQRVLVDALTARDAPTLVLFYVNRLRSRRVEVYPPGEGPAIGMELIGFHVANE